MFLHVISVTLILFVSGIYGQNVNGTLAGRLPAPLSSGPVVRCKNIDILSGFPCVLSDCERFRKLECNAPSDRDLKAVFSAYAEYQKSQKNAANTTSKVTAPLFVRLTGGKVNVSRDTFSAVADQLGKLEFNQVDMGNLTNGAFQDLTNLNVLDLNGVAVEVIPSGAFDGLNSVQIFSLRNTSNLSRIEPGALFSNSTIIRCFNINITDSNFMCDCNTNTWIQKRFVKSANLINTGTWQDFYAETDSSKVPCGINIVCSQNSADVFRQNVMNLNLDVMCSNGTMAGNVTDPAGSSTLITTTNTAKVENLTTVAPVVAKVAVAPVSTSNSLTFDTIKMLLATTVVMLLRV